MGDFDFDVIARSLPYLWKGMEYTLILTLTAMAGGIFFGTLLAIAKLSSIPPLSIAATAYVNLMRSTPLVLVIFWFYFLVPLLAQAITGSEQPVPVGPDQTALISFTLFEIAYYCEIIRAGIQSIPTGQVSAGKALGFTYFQQMLYVVLPQAFRNMLPVLLTQSIVLFQDTSLVYVISATDFLGAASKVAQRDSRLVEMYSFVAVIYFLISFTLSQFVKRLQLKFSIVR
ncbi:MAG: amino acid ABC transporter permease [Leptolyngbyaceae bacterium]|nr:amino acid ABC transporter permease [Leptolyngbyaceae bacterium]